MEKALVVRGKLSDPLHIELAEPISELHGEVEVVIRAMTSSRPQLSEDIFAFIAHLSPGTRSKEDIDRQIQEEQDAWGDR